MCEIGKYYEESIYLRVAGLEFTDYVKQVTEICEQVISIKMNG